MVVMVTPVVRVTVGLRRHGWVRDALRKSASELDSVLIAEGDGEGRAALGFGPLQREMSAARCKLDRYSACDDAWAHAVSPLHARMQRGTDSVAGFECQMARDTDGHAKFGMIRQGMMSAWLFVG